MTQKDFPNQSDLAEITYYRTYSRVGKEGREDFQKDTVPRVLSGIEKIGKLTNQELEILRKNLKNLITFPSGRWLWVGGTPWLDAPRNWAGAYNCISMNLDDLDVFGLMMELAMMGCGTGAVLEEKYLNQLPSVKNALECQVIGEFGLIPKEERIEETVINSSSLPCPNIIVGDSREGWVKAYQSLINLAFFNPGDLIKEYKITVDISNVRPKGQRLKGFGGVSNPYKLKYLFPKVAKILTQAKGRQLTAEECCLIIDEAALVIVAGNLRRSAGIRQFSSEKPLLKLDLWQQDNNGNFRIDPEKSALRMANHTRVWHSKPNYKEILEAVQKQIQSGEGAIQYAPEAIARANVDILDTLYKRSEFLRRYNLNIKQGKDYLEKCLKESNNRDSRYSFSEEVEQRLNRYGLNPCFAEGTLVATSEGDQRIETLVGKTVTVWDGEAERTVDNFRVTSENEPVYQLILDNEEIILATGYHPFILEDGSRKNLLDLKKGDCLMPFDQYALTDWLDTSQTFNDIKVERVEYSHVADKVYCCTIDSTHAFALANGILVGNCGEIVGSNFPCNLSEVHADQLDPDDEKQQKEAFYAAGLWTAPLLNRNFTQEKLYHSRNLDPIVGPSFTGGFDFFVKKFGVDWLRWWENDRFPDWSPKEIDFATMSEDTANEVALLRSIVPEFHLSHYFLGMEEIILDNWRQATFQGVKDYCFSRGLKVPNRYTCIKPSGCWTLEYLRTFDQGLLHLDELESCFENYPGMFVPAPEGYTCRGEKVFNLYASGYSEVIKITLQSGRSIKVTPNHPLSVNGEWIQAQDISLDDSLDYDLGTYTTLEPSQNLSSIEGLSTPNKVTPELAYVIGTLWFNSFYSSETQRQKGVSRKVKTITYKHQNKDYTEAFSSALYQSLGISGIDYVLENKDYPYRISISFNCPEIYRWMLKNGLIRTTQNQTRIPKAIRTAGWKSIISFLAGYIDSSEILKSSSPSYKGLSLSHIQQVGEAVGLQFYLNENHSSIALLYFNSKPKALDYLLEQSVFLTSSKQTIRQEELNIDLYKVKSVVKQSGLEKTFDLEVAPSHWYYQGGIKSHNTGSLLTNASPGWHPPKAIRYIRRITVGREEPIGLAALDRGFPVVPSQSDTDEKGNLLSDPFDPRVTEWLIEIPVSVDWADLKGIEEDNIDPFNFSIKAQFDFMMTVQKYWTTHNTSATLEPTPKEAEDLAKLIYDSIQSDQGYISSAILQKFDARSSSFPRLPFEPISKEEFDRRKKEVLENRKSNNFKESLDFYESSEIVEGQGPAGCDSDKCML